MYTKKILMLRHGETNWNKEMRFQGSVDIPLNEDGERQAATAAQRIDVWEPQAVFVSPLGRARRTAELAAGAYPGTVVDDLREICFGDWEGKTFRELKETGSYYDLWMEKPYSVHIPNSESAVKILERATRVLDMVKECSAERILLVSHGGMIRALLAAALEIPFSVTWKHFILSNCALSGITWNGRVFSLNFYNDCLHTSSAKIDGAIPLPIRF